MISHLISNEKYADTSTHFFSSGKLFTTRRQKPAQRIGSARAVASSEAAAARKDILAARKHRNRLSAAAHRDRKNSQIAELEQLVAELGEQNRFLNEALVSSRQPSYKSSQDCSETAPAAHAEAPSPSSFTTIQNTISPPAACAQPINSFQQ
mmetsp:Transcript_65670/g.132159  ORF Transcript_65670/g.132159 Transcript_65670/m.132159 type:complete len:152 (-) Transcript_65670:780-1235(-)